MSGRLAMSPDVYLELSRIFDLLTGDPTELAKARHRLAALLHPPTDEPTTPDDD